MCTIDGIQDVLGDGLERGHYDEFILHANISNTLSLNIHAETNPQEPLSLFSC